MLVYTQIHRNLLIKFLEIFWQHFNRKYFQRESEKLRLEGVIDSMKVNEDISGEMDYLWKIF